MHRLDRGYTLEEARAAVGPGWRELVERAWRLAAGRPISQVKEKMGALRVYVGEDRAAFYAAFRPLEDESLRTCEWCGRAGELRGRHYQEAIAVHAGRRLWWQKTLCRDDAWRYYVDGERWGQSQEWEQRDG